jgi:S1-C subfamily serine protease
MKRNYTVVVLLGALLVSAPISTTAKQKINRAVRLQERNTVSLDLEFKKKNQNGFERVLSFLNDPGPNGHATGFIVGEGLVMTAYHVVSGDLGASKKRVLGFSVNDELEVTAFVNGCRAKVSKIDKEADLALLEVCDSVKQSNATEFQSSLSKDERIILIANPHGYKILSDGTYFGIYSFRGLDYLSAKIEARDGYSGSPVYNEKAEVVGVFSGYDWTQEVALITPGSRARKLLEEYNAEPKTK